MGALLPGWALDAEPAEGRQLGHVRRLQAAIPRGSSWPSEPLTGPQRLTARLPVPVGRV